MDDFSDGPAAVKARWWLNVLNGGDLSAEAAKRELLPGAMPLFGVHTEEGRQGLNASYRDSLPWRVATVTAQSAFSVQAIVEGDGGARRLLRVDVEPQPPHRISLLMAPPMLRDNDAERSPSNTAAMMAAQRASHLLWDEDPVFVDDLAIRLLPDQFAQIVRGAPFSGPIRNAVLMVLVRSRYAEDALFAAVEGGTTQ